MADLQYNATSATAKMPVGLPELDAILASNMRPLAKDPKRVGHLLRRVRETLESDAHDLSNLRSTVDELKRTRTHKGTAATLNPIDALRYVSPEEIETVTDRITRERLRTLRTLIDENMAAHSRLVSLIHSAQTIVTSALSDPTISADDVDRLTAVLAGLGDPGAATPPPVPAGIAMAIDHDLADEPAAQAGSDTDVTADSVTSTASHPVSTAADIDDLLGHGDPTSSAGVSRVLETADSPTAVTGEPALPEAFTGADNPFGTAKKSSDTVEVPPHAPADTPTPVAPSPAPADAPEPDVGPASVTHPAPMSVPVSPVNPFARAEPAVAPVMPAREEPVPGPPLAVAPAVAHAAEPSDVLDIFTDDGAPAGDDIGDLFGDPPTVSEPVFHPRQAPASPAVTPTAAEPGRAQHQVAGGPVTPQSRTFFPDTVNGEEPPPTPESLVTRASLTEMVTTAGDTVAATEPAEPVSLGEPLQPADMHPQEQTRSPWEFKAAAPAVTPPVARPPVPVKNTTAPGSAPAFGGSATAKTPDDGDLDNLFD